MVLTVPKPIGNGRVVNGNKIDVEWMTCSPTLEEIPAFICVVFNQFNQMNKTAHIND